jgi:cytochrome P450
MKSAGLDADDLRIAARRIFGESIANGLGADLPTMRTLFAWRFVATPKDFPGMLPEESKVQQSRATGECCCRMWYRKLIADVSIHVDPRTRLTYALIGNMQRIDL